VLTPWRYRYIQSMSASGKRECFLCKAVQETGRDDENLVVLRGAYALVILNRYPYTWGHAMIAPYRHISQFEELAGNEWVEMMTLLRKLVGALRAVASSRDFVIGINVGRAAGAGLEEHIHLHVIPKDTEMRAENLHEELVKLARDLRDAL